ncbi:MAG: DUF5808 domain-containing protein [Acidobacteria bacterium]|nr:DUF5808 domain-containing protein [Acidobacteriota bacterium]
MLGVFYVNRDDASIFVEKRFGVGYTINLGNTKALVFIVVFLFIIGAILGISPSKPQSHAPMK